MFEKIMQKLRLRRTRRQPVAVFIEYYALGRCSVALSILEMLASKYAVDLYINQVWLGNSQLFNNPYIRVIDLSWKDSASATVFAKLVIRAKRYKLDWLLAGMISLFRRYRLCVTFDPHGFVRCISLFPSSKPVYVSLELYFRDNYFNLNYPPEVMQVEHRLINKINGLVIQSMERESLFRNEYHLRPSIPTFLLPVTHAGPPVANKSDYLQRKYDVLRGKKLLLHLGGIVYQHENMAMVEAFRAVKGWMLVFHGHSFGDAEIVKKRVGELGIENVLFTDEMRDDLTDIQEIVASCHAGICWYKNMSPNYYTAGKSSGKISAYLMCGLPVITNAYPSSRDAIEKTDCGVCIQSFDDLPNALACIETRYDFYSQNAINEYKRTYWFSRYAAELLNFIHDPSFQCDRNKEL